MIIIISTSVVILGIVFIVIGDCQESERMLIGGVLMIMFGAIIGFLICGTLISTSEEVYKANILTMLYGEKVLVVETTDGVFQFTDIYYFKNATNGNLYVVKKYNSYGICINTQLQIKEN